MKAMTRRSSRIVAGLLTSGAILVAFAGPTVASHVHVSVATVDEVAIGDTVAIPVALRRTDGSPLAGAVVTFYLHMTFAGVEGEAEIGRVVTDEGGVASLAYRPRLAGHHELRMEYFAAGATEAESTTTVVEVTGGAQLYHSPAGVDVPGVGPELLMVVLATVWTILLWVVLRIVAIARAGGEAVGARPEARR